MKAGSKKLIQDVIDALPYTMRKRCEKQFADMMKAKREPITTELVERLLKQIAKDNK